MNTKFKVIENPKYKNLDENDLIVDKEMNEFVYLLKRFLIGNTKHKKVIDISCFYNTDVDQLIELVNKIGG